MWDGPEPDQQANDGGVVPETWVTIAKGTFTMGSPTNEPCRDTDEARHKVTLTHGFELQSTEVTQAQFQSLMGYNPSQFPTSGEDCPVENVSWHEAAAYCNARSHEAGRTKCYTCSGSGATVTCQEAAAYSGQNVHNCPGYRFPTEAEWEYAYRAGTTTAYYSGANDGTTCYTCSTVDANADKIGWYCGNLSTKTQPIKRKQPNGWGLFDMAGNVWEWCHDWYQTDLGSGPAIDPWGAASGFSRVLRGASWFTYAASMRAADRNSSTPLFRSQTIGFRCCRTITP
jgi:formylglycine-generating enzyme required for sulfatase activity